MVSFVCQACHDVVKKPKVDSHCSRCRECWVLTCVDCNTAFEGEAFRKHTSCITEAEKYQGKLYVFCCCCTAEMFSDPCVACACV